MAFRLDPAVEWAAAIMQWKLGQPEGVARLIRAAGPVPEHAREWLASLALGQERKWRGAAQIAMRRRDDGSSAVRMMQTMNTLARFESLRREHAAARKRPSAEGRDARSLPGDAEAARDALRHAGLQSEADPLRQIKRMRAELKRPAVIDLDYSRKR